ncbi:hypothetical protein SK128_014332, partial [Halocaridina rubra]
PRIVRVSRLRRKSVAIEVPPSSVEEPPREETEWVEWRRVHDRVDDWLHANSQVEADESHVIAMLMETDHKKGMFF